MSKEKKENRINDIDSKILELKEKKHSLNNKISEISVRLKRQKPESVMNAEQRRKKLIEEKSGHLKVLKDHNLEKSQLKEKISSCDDQKPDKLKKKDVNMGVVPQDEDELNKMYA